MNPSFFYQALLSNSILPTIHLMNGFSFFIRNFISRTVLVSLSTIILISVISIIIKDYIPDRGEELEELKTGWEYQWGDAADFSNLSSGMWSPMKTFPGQPPGREENRYLLLRVKLPEIIQQDPILYIRSIHSLFELYIDGEIIYAAGNPGNIKKMPMDRLCSHFIPLKTDFSQKFAYFRIYSKIPFIGFQSSMFLSGRSSVILYLLRTELFELMLASVFIFAGLLSFLSQ